MQQDETPSGYDAGMNGYFSCVTHPIQNELLGKITVEILLQDRRLTRTSICLKLVGRIDANPSEEEAEHLQALLGMLFAR